MSNDESREFEPCRFCGNTEIKLLHDALVERLGRSVANCYCPKCRAQAPQSTWNTRTESARDGHGDAVRLTAQALREAADFVSCGEDDDHEREVGIVWRDAFTSSDGDAMPAGFYCYDTEYPEEGLHGPLGAGTAQPSDDSRRGDADPNITADELAAFNRFCDTCEDCDAGGYDVPKSKMQRLARIGLVRWCGGSRYETTEFGDSIRSAKISGQGG